MEIFPTHSHQDQLMKAKAGESGFRSGLDDLSWPGVNLEGYLPLGKLTQLYKISSLNGQTHYFYGNFP